MANNISTTSTLSVPTFVSRIIMIATYTQQTQTPSITSSSSTVQTDTQILHNISTQTKTSQTSQTTQIFPSQSSKATQTDKSNSTPTIDSSDSPTSTEVLNEMVESDRPSNLNKRRQTHKENWTSNKERKKVSFIEDQQSSPELLTVDTPMAAITPILETYGQQLLQPVQTFRTSSDMTSTHLPDIFQPLAPSIPYHNEFQPMTTQQTAAMAHVALINFFGTSGTISSILQTAQQTLTELSQLPNDVEVTISDKQEGMSLQTSTEHNNNHNNSQNLHTQYHTYHKQHLQTLILCNKITIEKVTEYHNITLTHILILIENEWEDEIHIHHKDRKHTKKDDKQ